MPCVVIVAMVILWCLKEQNARYQIQFKLNANSWRYFVLGHVFVLIFYIHILSCNIGIVRKCAQLLSYFVPIFHFSLSFHLIKSAQLSTLISHLLHHLERSNQHPRDPYRLYNAIESVSEVRKAAGVFVHILCI